MTPQEHIGLIEQELDDFILEHPRSKQLLTKKLEEKLKKWNKKPRNAESRTSHA